MSKWKLVPVEPTREMLDAAHTGLVRDGEIDPMLKCIYRAMLAAAHDAPSAEPVAWMSPGKERLEFSRPDTVYGSHTIPLYAIQIDAAEIARLRTEVDRLTKERDEVRVDYNATHVMLENANATLLQQAERIKELERDLNDFHMAVEHVTENGNTKRSFSTSEGWVMVHKDRLTDLEIAEERITTQSAALAESRANDRQGMVYLAQVRKVVGGADFPDMVSRVEAQSAALAKAQHTLRMVGQSLAWLAFRECRSYGEGVPLLKSHEADALCKETLSAIDALGQVGEEGKEPK